MLPLSRLQELPHELTLEQAQSAACKPLVADMGVLLRRLMDLSHLEDAGEQQVGREGAEQAGVWVVCVGGEGWGEVGRGGVDVVCPGGQSSRAALMRC
jgi:hypothetical protein